MTEPLLDMWDDYSPASTSSLDFLQALQAFLGRNQIDFIGPFRIRLESTTNDSWRLLVAGETGISDLNASNQLGLGLACPSTILSSPDDLSAHERSGARASLASDSSSVSDYGYSWNLRHYYSQDPGVFP
jgi:hypothetical protein